MKADLSVRIDEAEATITVGGLPTTWGDEQRLRQGFQNLLHNAIKYVEEDTSRIHIAGPTLVR